LNYRRWGLKLKVALALFLAALLWALVPWDNAYYGSFAFVPHSISL